MYVSKCIWPASPDEMQRMHFDFRHLDKRTESLERRRRSYHDYCPTAQLPVLNRFANLRACFVLRPVLYVYSLYMLVHIVCMWRVEEKRQRKNGEMHILRSLAISSFSKTRIDNRKKSREEVANTSSCETGRSSCVLRMLLRSRTCVILRRTFRARNIIINV